MNGGRLPGRRIWLGRCAVGMMLAAGSAARSAAPAPDAGQSPPGFAPLRERGAFDLALGDCEAAIEQLVVPQLGRLGYARQASSDATAGWTQLQAYYDQVLGSDWRVQSQFPPQHRGFKLRVWQRSGWLPQQPVFCAAWLDERVQVGERSLQLLVLAASRHGG